MTPELRHGLYAVDPKDLGGDKYEAEREQDRENEKARWVRGVYTVGIKVESKSSQVDSIVSLSACSMTCANQVEQIHTVDCGSMGDRHLVAAGSFISFFLSFSRGASCR